jgi:hypothetical protein
VLAPAESALDLCLAWYQGQQGAAIPTEQYCATRDVFEGRLSRGLKLLERKGHPADEAALLVAVLGEIGNNTFDHNLGHWSGDPGCCFACFTDGKGKAVAWIADQGRGVLASLRQVAPELHEHQAALEMAFEKVISGRHPERRGNGLKFVRQVINGHVQRGLVAVSGTGKIVFGGMSRRLEAARAWPLADGLGTLTVVHWRSA